MSIQTSPVRTFEQSSVPNNNPSRQRISTNPTPILPVLFHLPTIYHGQPRRRVSLSLSQSLIYLIHVIPMNKEMQDAASRTLDQTKSP